MGRSAPITSENPCWSQSREPFFVLGLETNGGQKQSHGGSGGAAPPHGQRLQNHGGQMDQGGIYKAVFEDSGKVLAERVTIADTPASRAKGLLGKSGLQAGEGLLITSCGSIHTFFMKFPIDVLFLAKDGMVIKAAHRLRPWRLCGCWFGCHVVLELAQGVLPDDAALIKKRIKMVKI